MKAAVESELGDMQAMMTDGEGTLSNPGRKLTMSGLEQSIDGQRDNDGHEEEALYSHDAGRRRC
jgi:hypothetical protein